MFKEEFEKLAGYEVSAKDYAEVIEPMYMACDLTKADFVKCLDRKRFAIKTRRQMENEMRKAAARLYEICGHCLDYETENKLWDLATEYVKRFYGLSRQDLNAWYYYEYGYEYETVKRGCTYPKALVFGYDGTEYGRLQLVK